MPEYRGTRRTDLTEMIANAFIRAGRMDFGVAKDEPDDDLLVWHEGLNLLRTRLHPPDNEEDGGSRSSKSDDAIPPHVLLRIVMDSYYCNDVELELGELSAMDVVDDDDDDVNDRRMFRLPSSMGMFYIRTFLISRALECAEGSIPQSERLREAVRWRRLKSMSDDARSLFRRMVFDYSAKALNDVRDRTIPESSELGKKCRVGPNLIITMATFCYANRIFPSMTNLLRALMQNETKSRCQGTHLLQSCYESFREMTTLLALDAALINNDRATPSRCAQWILRRIESQNTDDFFHYCVESQKKMTRNVGLEMHFPWSDTGNDFRRNCLSLEEDLLLYPSIGVMQDKSEGPSYAKFYDGMGIALLAYWKLWAQAQPGLSLSSSEICPLSPYRWTLLFPHVFALLSGWSSSTMADMEASGLSPREDRHHLEIDFTITSMGFDMLRTILMKTPAIRPMACDERSSNPIARWAHSARGLESTINMLLSHVVRTSSVELAGGNKSSSETAQKYSSLEIMGMTRTLISIFNPEIQVETLSNLCQALKKASLVSVLLPRVIDFVRPIIMNMCRNTNQYNHGSIALQDMTIMKKISSMQDTFLVELHGAFINLESFLPGDIDEFMSKTETYSAVFAIIHLQQIWRARVRATMKGEMTIEVSESFEGITRWLDDALSKLHYFDASLTGLINICETSQHPPHDWHLLFLMQSSLRDAFDV
ncbi:hypothetical protein ACHAW5_011147 [Stephanodiscus triporus]|uniref:Uncharacterized protein n=1 Tax=Stephanodiscus triporus TaxID=2934178 RepID=A0ABD3QVC8_9STRA